MTLHIVDHPLLHDIMARLRDRETSSDDYRALTYRVSTFLIAEATRDLPTREEEVETPLERTVARKLDSRVVAVPVLRASVCNGMRRPRRPIAITKRYRRISTRRSFICSIPCSRPAARRRWRSRV
jgi:hypothetical protein